MDSVLISLRVPADVAEQLPSLLANFTNTHGATNVLRSLSPSIANYGLRIDEILSAAIAEDKLRPHLLVQMRVSSSRPGARMVESSARAYTQGFHNLREPKKFDLHQK